MKSKAKCESEAAGIEGEERTGRGAVRGVGSEVARWNDCEKWTERRLGVLGVEFVLMTRGMLMRRG